MPNIPIVEPVVPASSGGSYARATPQLVTPTLRRPVRANPNMYEGVNAANQQIAQGLSGIGRAMTEQDIQRQEATQQLQRRVKVAADNAYITNVQTANEGEDIEITKFTKENPDPSTWAKEVEARISNRKSDALAGAKALSPEAQERLRAVVDHWEVGFRVVHDVDGLKGWWRAYGGSLVDWVAAQPSVS